MSDVFISYSHKDSDFTKKLTNSLAETGRDIWVDWEDIPRAADWLHEIYAGIEATDTFVFIISQNSLTSEICNLEVARARQHNKRIIPLILQEIQGDVEKYIKGTWFDQDWMALAQENWQALGHLNWIFFNDTDKFDSEFEALVTALEIDLTYIRLHTRYLIRALEWDRAKRKPSVLLFGDEIDTAEKWLQDAQRNDNDPQPNALHQAYITESRREEITRHQLAAAQERRTHRFRRASYSLAVMVIVATIVTLFAMSSANEAQVASYNAQTDVAQADEARASSEAFREAVEFDATVFAHEKDYDQIMLRRFGIVPTPITTVLPATVFARATEILSLAEPTADVIHNSGVDIVRVPAGCFLMGSIIDSAAPIHEQCFEDDFWIDRYEITRSQYDICVLAGKCEAIAENNYSSAPNEPINNVLWEQAMTYCDERGARLPTEREWEYAVRGPNSLIYPWGDDFNADYLVYISNSDFKVAPVGSRPVQSASWVGAMDMSGNVWEWVSTAFGTDDFETEFTYPYMDDERENLTREDLVRVIRGGSFNDDEINPRGANRAWLLEHDDDGNIQDSLLLVGFRCAVSEINQTPQG